MLEQGEESPSVEQCIVMALPVTPKKGPERAILGSGDELRLGSFYTWIG